MESHPLSDDVEVVDADADEWAPKHTSKKNTIIVIDDALEHIISTEVVDRVVVFEDFRFSIVERVYSQ